MPLLNKNVKTLFLGFCFSLASGKVLSNDSLYVKFIDQKIFLKNGDFYSVVKIKSLLYLFSREKCDSNINCFVFKKNTLISTGKLSIRKRQTQLVAEREGYWIFLEVNKRKRKVYFDNDEPIKEEELPIDESNNNFYIIE